MMKLKVIGPNQTEITMGGKVLFFSYDTLVIVRDLNERVCYCTSEKYSKTTSKHFNTYIKKEGITLDRCQFVSQKFLESLGESL